MDAGGGAQPGWYPDQQQPGQERYWDGSQWTGQVRPVQQSSPPPPQMGSPSGFGAPPKPPGQAEGGNWWGRLPRWAKWTIGIVGLLVIIGALSSPSEQEGAPTDQASTTEQKDENRPAEDKPAEDKPENCGRTASDDCTPHVGANQSVRVDAIDWTLQSAQTAQTIGDQEFGLGSKADGVFVIVSLQAHSTKSESVTVTDNAFQLEVGGNTYDPDNEGTTAAVGAGDEPFFLEDIGPDSTTTGKVVFDVPPSVLGRKPELRLNELGFGTTHGYIRLPNL